MTRPRLVGLTGGIATGKSAVARLLAARGAAVIDADQLAREEVEPGQPALAEIAARFPGVLQPDGRLDRRALASRIFGDERERLALNAILHPRIHRRFSARVEALSRTGAPLIVYEAPLLFENRLAESLALDAVIVVSVPPEVQLARLMRRDQLSREAAQARIASQLPLAHKEARATFVVDNGRSLADTASQVDAIWSSLHEGPSVCSPPE